MTGDDLSARLLAVAEMVSVGNIAYDVGCDHGFLSIYLVKHGISPKAYASDLRPGPVKAAGQHIADEGLCERISVDLRDGICGITAPKEPSTLILAGMGGPLILDILGTSPDTVLAFDELVVSPQSCIDEFRSRLTSLDLRITDEAMVYEAGKFYTVMKLCPGISDMCMCGQLKCAHEAGGSVLPGLSDEHSKRIYDRYGYILIESSDRVLRQYLIWERQILEGIAGELNGMGHSDRYRQVSEQISDNILVGRMMEGSTYGNSQD